MGVCVCVLVFQVDLEEIQRDNRIFLGSPYFDTYEYEQRRLFAMMHMSRGDDMSELTGIWVLLINFP